MSNDHEYTTDYHGILSTWPGDWRERAGKAEAERTQALAALAEMTKERDKWQSIALDSVRNGPLPDISERLKREADASHAMSTYTVPASGDDVLFERNNLAEALREVNARLMQVTKERDALRGLVEESIEHASWLEAYAGQLPFDSGFVASVRDYITRAKGAIQPKREDDHR